jgi:hypothetical protein
LHLLRNLQIDLEEFADAAVEAYAFALVEFGLTVVCGEAFAGARLYEAWYC